MSNEIQSINIFWGSDKVFEEAVHSLDNTTSLATVLAHISEKEINETDDYGGVMEWAILGFSNNVLRHTKIEIHNLW